MATVRFRSTVWDNPAFADILRWTSAVLQLGEPARYRSGPGVGAEWTIFDDLRFTLEHVALLGAVVGTGVGRLRQIDIPNILDEEGNDTGRIDREAAEANIRAAVPVVEPADITYTEFGNVWQETLDAQDDVPDTVAAEDRPQESWRVVGGEIDE